MVEQKLKTEDLTENSVLIGTSSRIADTLKKVEYVSCGSCMDGCAGRPAEGRRCESVTVKA